MLSVAKERTTGSCRAESKIIWVIALNWPASLFLKQLWAVWPMHASCHPQYHKNSTALVSKYEHFLNLSGSVKVVSVHWTEQMMGLQFIMTLAFLSIGERSWKQPNQTTVSQSPCGMFMGMRWFNYHRHNDALGSLYWLTWLSIVWINWHAWLSIVLIDWHDWLSIVWIDWHAWLSIVWIDWHAWLSIVWIDKHAWLYIVLNPTAQYQQTSSLCLASLTHLPLVRIYASTNSVSIGLGSGLSPSWR